MSSARLAPALVVAAVSLAGSPASAAPGMDLDNVQLCHTCHATVVAEWQGSMHSQAHHDSDPIYGAMRALRMTR